MASAPNKRVKRPLVNTAPLDEFGAAKPEDFHSPDGQSADLLYVPGFSELRRQRDIEMGEYVAGTRRGREVSTLPVNVRLVRASDSKGTPQGLKLMQAATQGYRPVTKQDVGTPWLTELPPGAREMPDGSLMTAAGDAVYMVTSADRAAANQARKRRAGADVVATLAKNDEGLATASREFAGSDPTITVS